MRRVPRRVVRTLIAMEQERVGPDRNPVIGCGVEGCCPDRATVRELLRPVLDGLPPRPTGGTWRT